MLAGRMKQKTFLSIVGAGAIAAITGGYFACNSGPQSETTAAAPTDESAEEPVALKSPTPPEPVAARTPAVAPQPAAATNGPSERPADQAVMRFFNKNLGSKKRKDVSSGQPFKINVYQDAGESAANRAKIDLDRDGKWDEKWTFKGSEISRKVSTQDDDNYDKKYVWQKGAWVAR